MNLKLYLPKSKAGSNKHENAKSINKLNLCLRLTQETNISISILDPSSYAIYSRTLKLIQLLYIDQTRPNILKRNRNSHTHLTETPSFAWYVAAALKPLS